MAHVYTVTVTTTSREVAVQVMEFAETLPDPEFEQPVVSLSEPSQTHAD